ncbi:MAG TPA: DUF5906 domain-containing protein [Methanoculleus sp.]|nr:DUF5906 domain-containing protein [Methanoculleus sp.]
METFNALQLLAPPGGVFEVRALGDRTASGYFDADHLEQAAKAIEALDATGSYHGIYVTLNPVNPALLSRRSNRIETRLGLKEATTADADIIRRRWFPVDIDVKRPSGISSTDEEHAAALEGAGNVAGFLSEFFGFPAPVRGDSGNGAHLLYRIDLPNDEGSRTLIERCLKALGAAFDRDPSENQPGWEIDKTTFNAARIWKLYGTVARKGDNTSERPHRRARIIEAPEVIEVVPRETLERLAALAPEEQPRQAPRAKTPTPRSTAAPDLTDAEIIEKCQSADNAAKFNALWRGDISGYGSHSEADLALCTILAFYSQDPAQLERLVRQSGLYREKWDRTDYVTRTISKALEHVGETWSPGRRDALKTYIRQEEEEPTAAEPEPEETRHEDLGALPPKEVFSSVNPKSGAVSLIYTTIADWIIATLKTITYRRTIYVYDRGRGIYRENDGDIEQLVQEIADRCGFTGRISTAKREVISYILDQEIAREYPFNSYPGIPCANGVVVFDFENGTCSLVPHSPEYRFTYRIPVTYDPAADPAEIRRVLASWADEGRYDVLLQIPAQAILQAVVTGKPFKKSYIIHGDTNGGKSSYIELIRRTFGSENIARVMLQQIGSDRFCLANLEGKLFNIYDDLDDVPLQNSSVLKAITGDDMHYVEKKGRDAYGARIFCVHIFTCNRPPSTPERVQNDAAFWGRWEFITFPNYFEVNPKWYDQVLTPATCSAYFNLVLEMALSIYQAGELPVKSSAYEVRDAWQTNSDPLYRFITENMDRSEAGYVLKDDAYSGFLNFARTENVPPSKIPPTPETFAKAVFKYGFAPARVRVDGARVQVFRGYAWKSTSQYKPGGATNATLQGGA